jgi:sulfite reductase beta subunit-like hemoprotein
MQRLLTFKHRHEEEEIKESGLHLDFDEMAKKGSMSKEEASIAKWFGIYGSRHPGTHMARVVIPGGVLTSTQARILAKVSEMYAQGKISVTTRQSLQLHWLKTPSLPDMMRGLAEEGLTTFHGCGDVNRNVAACPLAETCEHRRIDVRPYAKQISDFMAASRDLDNLPRKFKITLSGCGAGCAQPYINCVGIVAVQREGANGPETGFKVIIGGGMGWKAFIGEEVFSFVPADLIKYVSRASAVVFRDHGDRRDRNKSRMKYVVHRNGIEQCRKWILEVLEKEGVDTTGIDSEPFVETGSAYPERPLTADDPTGTDDRVTVRAIIPKGELNNLQMKRFAELSEIFGDKRVYTTNRQNIEIHGVLPALVEQCKAEVKALGYATGGSFSLQDIVPCVGTTYCPLAVSRTRDMYDVLMELVRKEKYADIQEKAIINITGCPNSCSPFRIADIGMRGMRIRETQGSVEGYEITLGGTHDQFGKTLGEFKSDDCPKVIESVLDQFLEIREGDETLAACVRRTGFGS